MEHSTLGGIRPQRPVLFLFLQYPLGVIQALMVGLTPRSLWPPPRTSSLALHVDAKEQGSCHHLDGGVSPLQGCGLCWGARGKPGPLQELGVPQ